MIRHRSWIFLLVFFVAASAAAASPCDQQRGGDQKKPDEQRRTDANRPEDPPRWKWWLHPDTKKDLRLTDKQSQKINDVFEAFIPKQRERWHEIEGLDAALTKMSNESTVDVSVFSQQVEKLEKLRADERIARAVMIYRIRLLLNPEQRVKVDAIRAKMDEDRRRQEEERRKQGKDDKRDHAPEL